MTNQTDKDHSAGDPRFDRQVRFAPLGAEGQAKLSNSHALLVGAGALGGVLAQSLVRAGVGKLTIVDRDIVELSNLPRQVLFEERHALEGTTKVEAARESLRRIGGPTELSVHSAHFDALNAAEFSEGADLVLDGTDNMATRYLINDMCVEAGIPWVYGGVVGSGGLVLAVVPERGACFRCVFPEPPAAGTLPTCDSAGVILPAVSAVASIQAGQALRLLAGNDLEGFESALLEIDVWHGDLRRIRAPRHSDCPCCGQRLFEFLHNPPGRDPVVLCGRNAVQLPASAGRPDLNALSNRLEGQVRDLAMLGAMLRFKDGEHRFTVFADGRALIEGTDDPDRARALYDRLLA